MRPFLTYSIQVIMLLGSILLTGCAKNDAPECFPDEEFGNRPERLVVQGRVTNEDSQALEGIRVDIYGVREEDESDVLSYNYAITDSEGKYTICRYLGRMNPKEVTVIASDPNKKHKEGIRTIVFSQLENYPSGPYLEIRADFILTALE